MIFIFYFFAAILVWLSFKSFLGGVNYLRFFRDELSKPRSELTPFVTVVCPCRGIDDGLEQNLNAILDQDYPNYEVLFVTDDETDSAVAVITDVLNRRDAETRREESRSEPVSTITSISSSASPRLCGKLVIATKAKTSSQKVENLREAVLLADPKSKVFVFVDSDARPAKNWLHSLVAPLADKGIGAASGYRWFISKRPTFSTELCSVWNASIASALGPNEKTNFCWGGSTAIRRDTFERLDIREKWRGAASDDFTLTHTVKAAGLEIAFVPQALTASYYNGDLAETIEFTNRQMKITRVYATPLWALSFFGSALFNSVMIAALIIVIFSGVNSLQVWLSIAVLLLITFFSIGKASLRLKAARLALTNYEADLKRQFLTQNTFWLIAPALFFINCVAALFSRRITWRGIEYELKSPTETVIISPLKNNK